MPSGDLVERSARNQSFLPKDVIEMVLAYLDASGVTAISAFARCCVRTAVAVRSYRWVPRMFGQQECTLLRYDGAWYLPFSQPNITSCGPPKRNGTNDMLTTWYLVRIDPESLLIHTGDDAFATTRGYWGQIGHSSVAYGMCYCCDAPGKAGGYGELDLRGSPFYFTDSMQNGGCSPAPPTHTFSHQRQRVVFNGGGYCGWTCFANMQVGGEDYMKRGGWHVSLGLLEEGAKESKCNV